MADLRFGVLGRVEVVRDGVEVVVGRGGAVNVLAGLLLSANTFVPGDALAEFAWGDGRPVNPRAALHSKVARLRRLLGGDVIETAGAAYRLRAGVDQVDLLRFGRLVSRAESGVGDEEAAAVLGEAIGLWRGEPLANTSSAVLASQVAPQLTERYLLACERWGEVSLRLGRAGEVAGRVAPLVEAHPFRETMVRLLMLALYHDGRQADALAVYGGLRIRLGEELGADPSPVVQDLHTAILRGTPVSGGVAGGFRLTRGRTRERRPATAAVTPAGDGGHCTRLRIDPGSEVRVALDPFISVLALTADALGRRRGAPQAWRDRVLGSLSPSGARAVLPITAPRYSVTPDSVTPLNPARETPVSVQAEWLHALPEDDLASDVDSAFNGSPPPQWQGVLRRPREWLHAYASAMTEAWQAVQPLWMQARPLLEREVERVGAAAVRGGLDLILDRLHPASQYGDHVLRIRDPEPASFELGNRPLVLVPMLSGVRALICNLERPDAVWVGYPLPGAAQMASGRAAGLAASDALDVVMGPVRARILLAAERPLTMPELRKISHLAPYAASHHCERLAAAGLIQLEHLGGQTWISQTSRGMKMAALFTGPA
jgi:DNA-binding SARP family transcriptional activator